MLTKKDLHKLWDASTRLAHYNVQTKQEQHIGNRPRRLTLRELSELRSRVAELGALSGTHLHKHKSLSGASADPPAGLAVATSCSRGFGGWHCDGTRERAGDVAGRSPAGAKGLRSPREPLREDALPSPKGRAARPPAHGGSMRTAVNLAGGSSPVVSGLRGDGLRWATDAVRKTRSATV